MKKSLKILTVGALAIGFAAGCSAEKTGFISSLAASNEDVYAFSALSATNILASFPSDISPLNNSMNQANRSDSTPSLKRKGWEGWMDRMLHRDEIVLSDDEIQDISQYIGAFETLLSDENQPIKNELLPSDNELYATKMVITTKTIDLADVVYTLYYNETIENQGTNFDLEGILQINDFTYDVVGEKIENTNRSSLTFSAKIDDDNYVRVNETILKNRRQFNYTVVANGEIVSQSKIHFVHNQNKEMVYLETTVNDEVKSYRFSKFSKDEETWIHMMVGSGITTKNVFIRMQIDEETGEYAYSYYAGNNHLGNAKRYLKQKFA